jgi:hypothetical protein
MTLRLFLRGYQPSNRFHPNQRPATEFEGLKTARRYEGVNGGATKPKGLGGVVNGDGEGFHKRAFPWLPAFVGGQGETCAFQKKQSAGKNQNAENALSLFRRFDRLHDLGSMLTDLAR